MIPILWIVSGENGENVVLHVDQVFKPEKLYNKQVMVEIAIVKIKSEGAKIWKNVQLELTVNGVIGDLAKVFHIKSLVELGYRKDML